MADQVPPSNNPPPAPSKQPVLVGVPKSNRLKSVKPPGPVAATPDLNRGVRNYAEK